MMNNECRYCIYARQDKDGIWYCTLISCVVEEVRRKND